MATEFDLSPAVQTVVTAIAGFIVAVIYQWNQAKTKNNIPSVSRDVVIPNITVADGDMIRDAARTMREAQNGNLERDRQIRDMQQQLQVHTEQLSTMIRLGRARNDLIAELNDHVREVLKRDLAP